MPNSYPPDIGGLETAVASIARELARRGHVVTVITTARSLQFSESQDPPGVHVHRMPFALPRLVSRAGRRRLADSLVRSALSPVLAPMCLGRLVRIIRQENADIVNLHYVAENAFYALAAQRFADFRLVVNLHGEDIERYPHRSSRAQWLTRSALFGADYVLANSAHILAQAERIVPAVRNNSAVVGNGVYLEQFQTDERFTHPRAYILSVGNFGHKKGFDILIQAFHQVRRHHPELDLVMAGDGYELPRCQRLASDLGLADSIIFLGKVPNSHVPALMKGCEVFVLPSRQEPFGIVLLEAMAAGKPVIATRVGGVPEIVTHMADGLLVAPESPQSLADAIVELFTDDALRESLGRKAAATIADRFTWEAVASKFIQAYESVLRQ